MEDGIFSLFPHENFFDLSIYQFGYCNCKPAHMFGPAKRKHFLFHYILSGKGILMSADDSGNYTTYYLGGGQGFLLWPEQTNTYFSDNNEPWEYAWIEFDGLKAKELVMQSGLMFSNPVYTSKNVEEHDKMKDELMHIITHADNPPLELIGHLYLFISALVSSSSKSVKSSQGSLRDFYVREATAYIEQNYQHEITIKDIAAYCNLNRSYLSKIFRTVLETTPQAFLISYRMKKACELLKNNERSIGEISNLVGYPNQLNFSRAFKREIGKSPRQWQNENAARSTK